MTLYDNPGGLDIGVRPVAGPIVVENLPTVFGFAQARLPAAGPVVGPDLWIGVRFTSRTAGLLLNDTPAIGTSHDFYFENGGFYFFGGDPKANFCLKVELASTQTGVEDSPGDRPFLAPIRPNPFRAGAAIDYSLDRGGPVRLEVLDLSGRSVRALVEGIEPAGTHSVQWDGRDAGGDRLPAGIYWVRLQSDGATRSRRVAYMP